MPNHVQGGEPFAPTGADDMSLVIRSQNSLAIASNRTTDIAAPESSRKVTGECPIKPLMRNTVLICGDSLLSLCCDWWFMVGGAGSRPPAMLARNSLKGNS